MFVSKKLSKALRNVMFVICSLLLSVGSIVAQDITVTGTVTDKNGEPIIGAYALIQGTTIGASTDFDGKYVLKVNPNANLVFTSMGYRDQVIPVAGKAKIDVQMEDDAMMLEDLVVVAYGTQKKANLTGAVSSVDVGKNLVARPVADVGRGLQGTTPGVTIVVPSGEVGSDPVIKIRGQLASIQGGTSPLILVDNVEVPSLSMVNPEDIESISVLKDAASSSIYGAKAAFGVILIATKKGSKTESFNISYSGNMSFQSMSKNMEMAGIDGLEYALLAEERVGGTTTGAFWKINRESFEKAQQWQDQYAGTLDPNAPFVYGRDWYYDPATNFKYGLRTYDPYEYMIKEWAPTQNHNASISGKKGNTEFLASFGYLDQTGINLPAKDDSYQKYNGTVKVSSDINKWVSVRAGAMFTKQLKNHPYTTFGTTADPWYYMYRWSPLYPWTSTDGNNVRMPNDEYANANTAVRETNYLTMNGGITVTPLKDWDINFDYSHANEDFTNTRKGTRFTAAGTWWDAPLSSKDSNGNQIYVDNTGAIVNEGAPGAMPKYQLPVYTYTSSGSTPDHVYRYAKNSQRNTINLNTTYKLNLEDKHDFNFMLGMNRVGYKNAYHWAQTTELIDINNPQFDLATGTQTGSGGEYWESQLGFFGRVNYNYDDRYLVEANLRYDGTSKFPGALQWRWFPSFSAGWNVANEKFMESTKDWLSQFKIRGSWGIIGDQTVSNSLYIPTMGGANTAYLDGEKKLYYFRTPGAVSADITWQDISTLDLGFDASFLNGDLGVVFDWFQRDTKNMIVPQEGFPATFGAGAPKGNYGSLRTNGYEIQLTYNKRFSNGLGINVNATFADAVTKITAYGDTQSLSSWYVGKTYGEIWGYTTDRLYQADDFVYDGNGDLIVEERGGYNVNKLADPNAPNQGKLQTSGNFKFGPGDVKYKDLNGDGVVNNGKNLVDDHGDLSVIGNSTPRYEYGVRTGLDFKGLDFSVFVQGVGKREIQAQGTLAVPGFNTGDGAMPQAIAGDFWTPENTDAFWPSPYNNAGSHFANNTHSQTKYLLDMSYLRIKNITLGYTFPDKLMRKATISKLRVYVSFENFFTFDNLNGLPIDPEVITGYSMWNSSNYNSGRTGVGIPAYKTASFGVQLNF